MNRTLKTTLGTLAALMVPVLAVAAINTYTFFDSQRGDIPFNALPLKVMLTDGKSDLGVPLTAAAGTPTGAMGVDRTAGTSLFLAGEATSSSAKTDKVMWELELGPTYRAGNPLTVTVNANYQGSGTVTGASTTVVLAAYSEVNGVETSLTVSPTSALLPATATDLVYTVTGTSLTTLQRVVIEATVLVTSASGANNGVINRADVSY